MALYKTEVFTLAYPWKTEEWPGNGVMYQMSLIWGRPATLWGSFHEATAGAKVTRLNS